MKQRIVATALVKRNEHYLFGWQKNKNNREKLILPGGKIEVGESPLSALQREFKEETNITLQNIKIQNTDHWTNQNNENSVHFIFLQYTADYLNGEPKAGSDLIELLWLKKDTFSDYPQTDLTVRFLKSLDMWQES